MQFIIPCYHYNKVNSSKVKCWDLFIEKQGRTLGGITGVITPVSRGKYDFFCFISLNFAIEMVKISNFLWDEFSFGKTFRRGLC